MTERPIVATILGVLWIIAGLFGLFFVLTQGGEVANKLEQINAPGVMGVLMLFITAGLSLTAGIGMIAGTRWGWWIATITLAWALARALLLIIQMPSVVEEYGLSDVERDEFFISSLSKVCWSLIITLYFFKDNVVEYFGVDDLTGGQRAWRLLGITAVLMVVFSGLGVLLG